MTQKNIHDCSTDQEKDIVIKDTTCNITLKMDPVELERTLKLSDEELQKALQQNKDNETEQKTSFFSKSKTSAFGNFFEKKYTVDDDIHQTAQETDISFEDINRNNDNEVVLQNLERSFEIISRIGEGGQGTVSSAADRSLGRIVALKSLHANLLDNKKSREHFISEAKITAQLDYPGIVPIYSLNSDGKNGLHLAMKFINGETLSEYLNRIREQYSNKNIKKFNEGSSIRKRLEIFLRSCDAVAYAHSRNVMHCDLKPENIMLGQHNDSYIMDWGIARLIHDPAVHSGKIKKIKTISGTPRYLAPEALDGKYLDERADIYALGLILFECVFLKSAFCGRSTKEVLNKVRNHRIEKFSHAFGYKIDRDLLAIIRKATEFDRDNRYQSVTDFADDIRHYIANEETKANPDNIFGRMIRFSQHHVKAILILIFISILVSGGALSHSVYQQYRYNQFILERDVALSSAYSRALYVAGLIELQMNNIANTLKSLSAYTSFLLKIDVKTLPQSPQYFFVSDRNNDKNSYGRVFFSEACNMPITLDRMSFNHPNGKYTAEMKRTMEQLQMLQPVLKKSLLYDNVFRPKKNNETLSEDEAEKYYRQNSSPILWFYGGFENGLYFNLPGQTDRKRQFDPRQRSWYKAAAAKTPFDGVVWSTPYIDISSKRMTLTASMPIFLDGKLQGVIAVDNTLLYISRFMKNNGNTESFLLEKVIVDTNGQTLFSSGYDYSVQKNMTLPQNTAVLKQDFFENDNVFRYIKKNHSGVFNMTTENGRNIVYLFYNINSLNWFYIEKIDIDMLMEHIYSANRQ